MLITNGREESRMLHALAANNINFTDYLFLRMDPVNIQWTGHSDFPDVDNLKIWYQSQLLNENRKIILFYDERKIVGYLYLDWINIENGVEISYGTHSCFSGRGYGKTIVEFAVQNAVKYFPKVRILSAWIADNNLRSVRCALNAGINKKVCSETRDLPSFGHSIIFSKYCTYLNK